MSLGAVGFGLACHWLKNWGKVLKPITKCSVHNHVVILLLTLI